MDPLDCSSTPNPEADAIFGTHDFAENISQVDFNLQSSEVFCQSIGSFPQLHASSEKFGYQAKRKEISDVDIDLLTVSSSHLAAKALSAASMFALLFHW